MAYTTSCGISGGQTQDAARVPSVDSAITRLRERLSEGDKLLDSVEGRFGSVMRNMPPTPVEKNGPTPSAGCALADLVTELETQAIRLCSRLHSIVDRCEL